MPPDRNLDRELRNLGPHVEYPQTPDLARSVRGRLEAEAGGPGSPARSRPQFWWIAAAALVLLVAVPVVSLALRETGGAFSAGGDVAESGRQEARDPGPNRLAEESAAGDNGSLAAGADGGEQPSGATGPRSSAASTSAEAACGWPQTTFEARPPRGVPGDGFAVRGRYFEADVGDCGRDPARRVRIVFSQGGRSWELGGFEVSEDARLVAKLKVPAEARPGQATVRATYERRSPEDPNGRASVETRFSVLD